MKTRGRPWSPQSRAALDESHTVEQRGYFSGVICQVDIPAQGYLGLSKAAPLPPRCRKHLRSCGALALLNSTLVSLKAINYLSVPAGKDFGGGKSRDTGRGGG